MELSALATAASASSGATPPTPQPQTPLLPSPPRAPFASAGAADADAGDTGAASALGLPSPSHPYNSLRGDPPRLRAGGKMEFTSPVAQPASAATPAAAAVPAAAAAAAAVAAPRPDPKTVRFELVSAQQHKARLPMRVQIYPHDTTESIVTTVKNFYGLYSSPTISKGVSFEDEQGNTLIARYENFRADMVVYVRVFEEPAALSPAACGPLHHLSYHSPGAGAHAFHNGDPPAPLPAALHYGPHELHELQYQQPHQQPHQQPQQPHISRPGSRTSRVRSPSPNGSGRGRRSASTGTNPKTRLSRPPNKARGPGSQGQPDAVDSLTGYTSGDGAPGSASGRSKEQQLIGNTEISVENIVEGGRRKRAKFESSELPLFVPPQMPATTSNTSASPARRMEHSRSSLPFAYPGQNPFAHPRPLQSPQASANGFAYPGPYATPVSDSRRARGSIGYPAGMGMSSGSGILPTPDPTVGSCMSEEDKDVAMQLMRLGDISNLSYGRMSASGQDDTFSGKADAASSIGATSDAESDSEDEDDGNSIEMPPVRKQRLDLNGNSKPIHHQLAEPYSGGEGSGDDADYDEDARSLTKQMGAPPKVKRPKALPSGGGKPRAQQQHQHQHHQHQQTHQHQHQHQQHHQHQHQQQAQQQHQYQQHQPQPQQPVAGSNKAKSLSLSSASSASSMTSLSKTGRSKPAAGTGNSRPKKAGSVSMGPMSPASLPASRKPSIASNVGGFPANAGEDGAPDLSTQPRCQRCRRSKKGCDRQRPCGRCRDAGISAELCVSEDEGNGRKGRYGRHMGVPLKKDDAPAAPAPLGPPLAAAHPAASLLPAAPIAAGTGAGAGAGPGAAVAAVPMTPATDKGKKRKR